MTAAQILKAFYTAYAQWIEAGAPDDKPFSRKYGLCSNLRRHIKDSEGRNALLALEVRDLMDVEFDQAKLDHNYPFGETYFEEARNRTMHTNQRRINWVFDRAE